MVNARCTVFLHICFIFWSCGGRFCTRETVAGQLGALERESCLLAETCVDIPFVLGFMF